MAHAPRHALVGTQLSERFTDLRPRRDGDRFDLIEAHDRRTDRPVVIKVPHPASGGRQHDVLRNEGRILDSLGGHRHILTCYERLTLTDGRPALVLEHCARDLYDVLQVVGAMQLRTVVAIGIKLAGALEAVHMLGVLHCDVRPRTVLVDREGEPVLAAFDEAVRTASAADRPPLHHPSPHTAPELLDGGLPSAASDVYGLASTLYELVAGRTAFRLGNSPGGGIRRVLSNPDRPTVSPNVPLEISDLLTWAMSPRPQDRPPSPAWLAEDLGRIEARQGWPRTRMVDG